MFDNFQSKAVYYSLMMTFICVIKLYGIIQILKLINESSQNANKISILTIGMATGWDTYLFLFHLYEAMDNDSLFHFFITPSFWYFILSSIFEMRFLVILWKFRYMEDINDGENENMRSPIVFYLKLYCLLIGFLISVYYLVLYNWFVFISYFFFLPQIIHNAMRGQNCGFDFNYIFFFIGIRILIPLYFRGCPNNLFRLTPGASFCFLLNGAMCLQIFIIFLQMKFGSRFFIPKICLPPIYNYFVDYIVDLNEIIPEYDDCVICMLPFYEEPISEPIISTPLMEMERSAENHSINDHHSINHISCLTEWMKVKLQCPTCRKKLPSLE